MDSYKDELVSIEDVCELLNVGNSTVYKLLKNKEIKAFQIGHIWKIPRIAVEEYILRRSGFIK